MSETFSKPSWDIVSQKLEFINNDSQKTGQKYFGEKKNTNQNINVIETHKFDLSVSNINTVDFGLYDDNNHSFKHKKSDHYVEYRDHDFQLFDEIEDTNDSQIQDFGFSSIEHNKNNSKSITESQDYDTTIRKPYSNDGINLRTNSYDDFPLHSTRTADNFSLQNISNPNPNSFPNLNDITNSLFPAPNE